MENIDFDQLFRIWNIDELDLDVFSTHMNIITRLILGDEDLSIEKHYGEIARTNGDLFEKITCTKYETSSEFRESLHSKISEYFGVDFSSKTEFHLEQKHSGLVPSIYGKKTKSKTDITLVGKDVSYGISVKMSNKGTQLQIIPLKNFWIYFEYNNIKVPDIVKEGFNMFCGLGFIKPPQIVRMARAPKLRKYQRWWLNEMDAKVVNEMVNFLKTHYHLILQLIFSNGLCLNDEDKPKIFIFNNSYFTQTSNFVPTILSMDDILKMYPENVRVTKNGNFQISNGLGLQMKGSGKGSAYHSLQFKDNGTKKKIEKYEQT